VSLVDVISSIGRSTAGVVVTFVLWTVDYLRDLRKERQLEQKATIDQYLEWLHRKRHAQLTENQQQILDRISENSEEARLARSYLDTVFKPLMEQQQETLEDIKRNTDQLPDMRDKLQEIVHQIGLRESIRTSGEQVAICCKVLDVLASGLSGAGVRIMMSHVGMEPEGTITLLWKLGTKSPNLMLADYVGSLTHDRLSLILHSDQSVSLRGFDADGGAHEVRSRRYDGHWGLLITARWQSKHLELLIDGRPEGSVALPRPFEKLGPLFLLGIDVEGNLSADSVRWGHDPTGLELTKDGICHGSRLILTMAHRRALEDKELLQLVEDPYCMIRPTADQD